MIHLAESVGFFFKTLPHKMDLPPDAGAGNSPKHTHKRQVLVQTGVDKFFEGFAEFSGEGGGVVFRDEEEHPHRVHV